MVIVFIDMVNLNITLVYKFYEYSIFIYWLIYINYKAKLVH